MLDSHALSRERKSDKSHIKLVSIGSMKKHLLCLFNEVYFCGCVRARPFDDRMTDSIRGRILNKLLFLLWMCDRLDCYTHSILISTIVPIPFNWMRGLIIVFDSVATIAFVLDFCSCCSRKHTTTQWINKLLCFRLLLLLIIISIQTSNTNTVFRCTHFFHIHAAHFTEHENCEEKTRLFSFECVFNCVYLCSATIMLSFSSIFVIFVV